MPFCFEAIRSFSIKSRSAAVIKRRTPDARSRLKDFEADFSETSDFRSRPRMFRECSRSRQNARVFGNLPTFSHESHTNPVESLVRLSSAWRTRQARIRDT